VGDLSLDHGPAPTAATARRQDHGELCPCVNELNGLESESLPGIEVRLDKEAYALMAVELSPPIEACAY